MTTAFQEAVAERTAGSPSKDQIWTDLTVTELVARLAEKDLDVGPQVVRDLLRSAHYGRRRMQKYLDMDQHKDRDAQFQNIARLRAEYEASDNPILSIDTKKKEWLGLFTRAGQVYTQHQPLLAYDHDYQRFATGIVVPYGLYDLKHNLGYVNLGQNKDTSELATDSIEWWWTQWGQHRYPKARSLCLLADGGGSNHVDKYLFKEDLQKLANRLGLEIRMAHYPPYCSKYNPIERRLFCHLTRVAQGVLFDSVATVKALFEKTWTATGLSVSVGVTDKVYELGRKYAKEFRTNMPIVFDDYLRRWNYRAIPQLP